MLALRLIAAAMVVTAFAAPAKADVIYDLTLANGVTGVLDLNFSSITAAENISYTSIAPYFVSLTISVAGSQEYTIDSSGLADGYINTGATGQLYTLTLEDMQPSGGVAGAEFLNIYTNSWNLQEAPWDITLVSGGLTIGSPTVSSPTAVADAPEPSTLAVMIAGLCGLGFFAHRKRQRGARRNGSQPNWFPLPR